MIFVPTLEGFLKRAQTQLAADINAALYNNADGGCQLFSRSRFHNVKPSARGRDALGEDAFLKRGIHKNEQPWLFRLERLDKFQGVAGTQLQRSYQQLRVAFGDLCLRGRYAVRFATHDHVRLRIEISADPEAKQRLLIQYQDSHFRRMLA